MTSQRDKSPLIPMASMTGCPSRELIRRRLHQYADVGIKQFLIYPRSGCELDYMGENWLEACRHVLECAEELDMDIWLYDEFNWPSGRCNGEVTDGHPEFCAKTLSGAKTENGTIEWDILTIESHADLFNPVAMERFVELTHKRYEKHFASYLGTRIKGIFTDEPSFMYGRGRMGDGTSLQLPYYDGLDDDYAAATGRVLRDDLAKALNGTDVDGLWIAFHGVLGQRFRDTFFAPIREWCDAHGMVSTGHLMCECPPSNSVKASGAPLAALKAFSLPGVDEISTRLTFDTADWGMLMMARYGSGQAGNTGLAEIFALGPVDMPFGKLRQMIWLMGLHGITEYVLAVSPLDARGNLIKRAYFTAFTPAQTWFDELSLLAEDATQAAEIAHAGVGPGVAIRYPWTLACEDAGQDLRGIKQEHRSGWLYQLAKTLIGNCWPVRLIDEDDAVPDDAVATIEIDVDAIRLTAGAAQTAVDSVDDAIAWIDANAQRPFRISGDIEFGNVFAEILPDGRICLLNMTDHGLSNVCVEAGSMSASIRLPARGVRVLDSSSESDRKLSPCSFSAQDLSFAMELDRANLMRCRLTPAADGTTQRFQFRCDVAATGHLIVRSPQELDTVRIDGQDIALPNDCDALTEGIREFYKTSAPLDLVPGEHTLELTGNVDDAPFLPAAFIAGDFGLFADDVLAPLPDTVGCTDLRDCGLRNYVGRVTLTGEIAVPAGAGDTVLSLETGEHIAEVSIDGASLGVRAWAPFEWTVPADLRGKTVPLEIVLTPSIGAMFDHPEEVDGEGKHHWLKEFWPGKHAALGVLAPPAWFAKE